MIASGASPRDARAGDRWSSVAKTSLPANMSSASDETRQHLSARWSIARSVDERVDTALRYPVRDLARIESEQVAPLHVRDSSLGDETPNVPDTHAEAIGGLFDVQQPRLSTVWLLSPRSGRVTDGRSIRRPAP